MQLLLALSDNYQFEMNLNRYSLQNQIGEDSFYKIYQIKNKFTGKKFVANISQILINTNYSLSQENISSSFKIISKLDHSSILKYIGYSLTNFKNELKPVIISESFMKKNLSDFIQYEKKNHHYHLNDTLKLINIYGIAAAMSYLHSNDIVHLDLKPSNVLLDEFCFPKISNYVIFNEKQKKIAGTSFYIAPETWRKSKIKKSSNVYSFAIIVYEIMTNEVPFKKINLSELPEKVQKGDRPQFKNKLAPSYQILIEKCWSPRSKNRPKFDEILDMIKNDHGFITDNVDEKYFLNYIHYIDKSSQCEFDKFINFQPEHKYPIKSFKEIFSTANFFTWKEFVNLDDCVKSDIKRSENNPQLQFFIAQNFIEGRSHYPTNVQIGLKYLHLSIKNGYNKSIIYYIKLLIKGKYIPMNLKKANNLIGKHLKYDLSTSKLLKGDIYCKEKSYSEAINVYLESIKMGNSEAMFKYAKLFYDGKSSEINEEEAQKYIINAINCGCIKAMYKFGRILIDSNNKKQGLSLIKNAVYKGHVKSIYYYSQLLKDGEIIPKNHDKSLIFLKEAADRGHVESMYQYGYELSKKYSETMDNDESITYLKKASDRGDINSIFQYGMIYYKSDGVKPNSKKAAKYLNIAAHNDHIEALVMYGDLLCTGFGIPIDQSKAKKYYKLYETASDKRDKEAIQNFSSIIEKDNNKEIDNKIVNIDRFKIQKSIGSGSFGDVYQVIDIYSKKVYAAKVSNTEISGDYINDEKTLLFFREVKLMSILCHPSIIRFIGFSPIDFDQSPNPTIISEYAPNGTLENIINLEASGRAPEAWNETKKMINIYGIASGMRYLHSYDIIHRDLKPGNILLDENFYPKITDFGLSKMIINKAAFSKSLLKSFEMQSKQCFKGTPLYMPPESLHNLVYSKPGDVFAFSIILYQILTLRNPYLVSNFFQLYSKVVTNGERPKLTDDIPEPFQILLERCWNDNPYERPTFDEIVTDLKNNDDYISDLINLNEYYQYIDFIENGSSSFDLKGAICFQDLKNGIQKMQETEEEEVEKEENEVESEGIESYFKRNLNDNDSKILLLYGKVMLHEKKFEKAIELFQRSSSYENIEAMYEYGKMLFFGKSCIKNSKEAMKYFILSKICGFDKSTKFLNVCHELASIKEFNNLDENIQLFFVAQIIKNDFKLSNGKWLPVLFKIKDSQMFYDNILINYTNLIPVLNKFKQVLIQIIYPSLIFKELKKHICELNLLKDIIFSVIFSPKCKIIERFAFENCSIRFEKEIPDSINRIERNAFYNSLLTQISIPSSICSVERFAFSKCSSLVHIVIPSSVIIIGRLAFNKCTSLIKIEIPSSVKRIGRLAFNKCSSLMEMTIPFYVSIIERHTFNKCTSITQIIIPSSVYLIGDYAFNECSSLKQITIPSSVCLIGNYAFYKCSSLKEIIIKSPLRVINRYVFSNCTSLSQITIPSSVTSIKEGAFYRCSSLKQITISYFTLDECSSPTQIIIPSSQFVIGDFSLPDIMQTKLNAELKIKSKKKKSQLKKDCIITLLYYAVLAFLIIVRPELRKVILKALN